MIVAIIIIMIICGVSGVFISLLALFRNEYTCWCATVSNNCIKNYTSELLKNGKYDSSIDYYDLYTYGYRKHLYDLTMWGRYSMIKPEYRELLMKYDTTRR